MTWHRITRITGDVDNDINIIYFDVIGLISIITDICFIVSDRVTLIFAKVFCAIAQRTVRLRGAILWSSSHFNGRHRYDAGSQLSGCRRTSCGLW